MPRYQEPPDGSGTPTLELVQEDAAAALRIRHEGVSGNAIEVAGPGGVTLWSVDRAGNPSGVSIKAIGGAVAAHTITDADFATPTDGALGINTTINEFVYRSGGSWYKARGSSDYFVASSTAPSFLKASAEKVCDGVADDVEINAAIVATTTVGGRVRLSGGSFALAARVTHKSNVNLCGMGAATVLQAGAGVSAGVVTGASGDAITDASIEDLLIDGGAIAAVNGIQVTNGSRLRVERVRIQNVAKNGVVLTTHSDADLKRLRIDTPSDAGIEILGGTDNTIDRCTVLSSGSSGVIKHGIYLTSTAIGTKILNARVDNPQGAMSIFIDSTCTDTQITGGRFTSTSSNKEAIGIVAGAVRTVVTGVNVDTTGDNGISVSANECTVTGCTVKNAWNNGIYVAGSNCTVTGNTVHNCNLSGSTFAGINLPASSNNVVTGNRIYDDQGVPTMAYGIKEVTSATNHTYSNNTISGAVTAPYLLLTNSTSKLTDSGKAALTDGATVNVDAAVADALTLSAAGSRTIAAPTNVTPGRRLWVEVLNNTAGVIVTTWNAAYNFTGIGGWTDPAAGKKRFVLFEATAATPTLVAVAKATVDY